MDWTPVSRIGDASQPWSGSCQIDDETHTPLPDAEPVPRLVLVILGAALLGGASPAAAGPICEDRAGEAVRCEDPRAMPLGWTLPLDERLRHPDPGRPEPTAVQLGGVFTLILLFFALIALMPDFDGWTPSGAEQEDDDGEGRD